MNAAGYRPASVSVALTTDHPVQVTASIWHRPLIPEVEKDTMALRRAQAGLTLVLLDRPEKVWSLLEHSADPQVRSYVVIGLKAVGAGPKAIAAQLASIGTGEVTAPVGDESRMETILFHPEISKRRALILALGGFESAELSPADRESLIARLLDTYRADPDAGIHGAAAWTLRRWKQEDKLAAIDETLWRRNDWGKRRWRVNIQGQTLTLIDGPLRFKMGSRSVEFDREFGDKELLHRTRIDRGFAISTKEVSNLQYFRFIENVRGVQPSLNTGSPEPTGPCSQLTWYAAAEYCNWLSAQENLEPCYEPNSKRAYDSGMKLVDGFLKRSGYRLPTEAEWEYACRAGAVTSRYFGESARLDGYYASYLQKPTSCGLLQPNDLGLFDMLGNVAEWCLDDWVFTLRQGDDAAGYSTGGKHVIDASRKSVYRGFYRAAYRYFCSPQEQSSGVGFRIVRTLP
jgi:formylglycine-generating enzyme required for sulfatase activity